MSAHGKPVSVPPPRKTGPGEASAQERWPVTLERLTRILEYLPDIVMEIDDQGQIVYINRLYPPYTREQVLGSRPDFSMT